MKERPSNKRKEGPKKPIDTPFMKKMANWFKMSMAITVSMATLSDSPVRFNNEGRQGQGVHKIFNNADALVKKQMNWNPGILRNEESYVMILSNNKLDTEKDKNIKNIYISFLRYRDNNSAKIELNPKSLIELSNFLMNQKGQWPEEGSIFVLTDKLSFPPDIKSALMGFTREFTVPNRGRLTITGINGMGKKSFVAPVNLPEDAFFNSVITTEICNTMFIKISGYERDRLCMSIGLAAGAVVAGYTYEEYLKMVSNVTILDNSKPIIFGENPEYNGIKEIFENGSIIKVER